ncbi:MAG: aldo/keto reductase [Synechococcus sp. TMED187]|jgi:predicted aldo/keto reductase-like oxidoreductase|uniref:aldo/keto reductase n=1 Tax=Synechococcus sp. UW105 TaxID=337067 RepID=UPI000B62BC4D|nr:aldo/keto reductase [Synechococcus sp. UW105]MAS27242.1 aldo/keto reductase [Synechococcus sp. NAT40]OUW46630.1 MAG: aldo/keto reductase [Synechococcus sp. TMED187]
MAAGLPTRRFGRTELSIPVLSLGGMRFQQSWTDLPAEEIKPESQKTVEATLQKAVDCGFHHVETARHYGSSERQIGWALPKACDPQRLLQTKVPPREDPAVFERELELSVERLGGARLDLLAIHGINLSEHLDWTIRSGGCLEVVRRWQSENRIGHVGFSTHGPTDLILKAIATDRFDYVNLHWYFIRQDNDLALTAARRHDMGVFIISPTDKGGHLHTPSPRLVELCAPLHPIVFNDLFCLSDPRVHTISVGPSQPSDLDLHLEAVALLDQAPALILPIIERLQSAARMALGDAWCETWQAGLPSWEDTPGEINLPVLLWLHGLVEAWGLEGYAKARYGLLGQGSHWFPGANADLLDRDVSEACLRAALTKSPWADQIPTLLRGLRQRVGGCAQQRLAQI